MKITASGLGFPGHDRGARDTTTARARIDVSFRPKEIERILLHVGREGRAKSETAVVFPFRGELVIDFEEEGSDTLSMQLNLALEEKR